MTFARPHSALSDCACLAAQAQSFLSELPPLHSSPELAERPVLLSPDAPATHSAVSLQMADTGAVSFPETSAAPVHLFSPWTVRPADPWRAVGS